MAGPSDEPVLVMQVESHFYALPLAHVHEILRPLAVEPVAGAPPFVLGVSVVRGVASPVVDLHRLLVGPRDQTSAGRWVRLRVGARDVLLAVDAAAGVRAIDPSRVTKLPPLLDGASRGGVDLLTTLDDHLVRVLSTGLRLPDDAFSALSPQA